MEFLLRLSKCHLASLELDTCKADNCPFLIFLDFNAESNLAAPIGKNFPTYLAGCPLR